ncbi:MAG: aminoacyl-tRNA hydrolase [Melioribacteraceae bacterium]|nr:aminoacyl-tRNA hydrolase [Melioribacteraceae bacterium]
MKLIIGIGNPGVNYINTRHNVGFQILEKFSQVHNLNFRPSKSKFWFVESKLHTFHFFLVKPFTYVNNSGVVVKEIIDHFNIKVSDTLIIYDDTNLDTGVLRIRKSGSDGGHNGLKSIIYHLENDNFPRLRIGIGSPSDEQQLADYVLSNFTQDDLDILIPKYPLIIELIEKFIISGSTGMLDHFSKVMKINSPNIS